MGIPKIIHQIWYSEEPLPETYKELSQTWKRDYPEWEYILWDKEKMDDFVQSHYPQYWKQYNQFPYPIQRCDAIRYLFLYEIGGMYVDLDYESIRSIEPLIKGKTCCFSEEQGEDDYYRKLFGRDAPYFFNNAMMLSIPKHFFIKQIIKAVFEEEGKIETHKNQIAYVVLTTGPWKIMNLYYDLSDHEKREIYILPKEYVTPLTFCQIRALIHGNESEDLERCLQDAFAIHYFFNSWSKEVENKK